VRDARAMALTDSIKKGPESEGPATVVVLRDALESLRLSLVATTLHHSCKALSSDAKRARDELDRAGATALTGDLTRTWLEYQPLTLSAPVLSDELRELVARSNRCLTAIQSILGNPFPSRPPGLPGDVGAGDDASIREATGLFHQLWTSSTLLVGKTRESSRRVMTDLEQVIDQAGLNEPTGGAVTPIREGIYSVVRAPYHGIEREWHALSAAKAKRQRIDDDLATNVTQLPGKVAGETVDTRARDESRDALTGLSNPADDFKLMRNILRPEVSKNQPKEPLDESAA
jgi:hypothetical protein